MTAYSMKEDRERFLAQGMDDYLSKPIRASLLIEKVQQRTAAAPPQTPPPTAPETEQSPVWEVSILRQLKSIGGAELVQAVLDDFVEESGVLVTEAQEAFARQDIALVKSHLHTLKGSAGTVGVVEVAEIARQAEGRLKEGDASQLQHALEDLQRAYQRFLDAYRQGIPA
jgi:HPt (histidine-containing phosphotransfer) domain-containing protein